jgi:DNA-binding NtrC family response regulator
MSEIVRPRNKTTEILDKPKLQRGVALWIEVLNATATPNCRSLTNGAVVLGAGLGCDIVIEDPKVSRRHLQLGFVNRQIEAIDLGSRNGSFCNGQRFTRLTLEKDATLQLGDVHVRLILKHENAEDFASGAFEESGIIGKSECMVQVFHQIERLSGTTVPVLICGESGTGKEVIARAIHQRSIFRKGPFIVVNCSSLEPTTARVNLFGQGIDPGAFEQAAGGTLFIDSIGELPIDLQTSVMRVLDHETVTRVGERQDRKLRTRIITASQYPLGKFVDAGLFRPELSYRLGAIKIELPPLRERGEDLLLLSQHFAAEFDVQHLPPEVLARLGRYEWPGNVRELRNVVRGFAVLGELPAEPRATQGVGFDELFKSVLNLDRPYQAQKEELVDKFVATYLNELLRRTNGNQSEAAKIAGIERSHLNRMISKLKRTGSRFTVSVSESPGKIKAE